MKFLSKCELLEKTVTADGVREVAVLGIAPFRTEPRRMHVGRHSLRAMRDIASQMKKCGVVCFAAPDVKDFYVKEGFYVCGKHGEKFILASFPAVITTTEEW